MLIPKGKTIVWGGVTYRPGQKVAPAHKAKVRELLLRGGQAPSEEKPEPPEELLIEVEPEPVKDIAEIPVEDITFGAIEEPPEEPTEEKPKKSRRKRKKEIYVDES